jgi:hypothetical protein
MYVEYYEQLITDLRALFTVNNGLVDMFLIKQIHIKISACCDEISTIKPYCVTPDIWSKPWVTGPPC